MAVSNLAYIILVAFKLIFIGAAVQPAAESYTMLEAMPPGNSYLEYPGWTAPTRGRIEFSFKTYASFGTLMFVTGVSYVHLQLFEGKLHCTVRFSTQVIEQATFFPVNDNQWYSISVVHRGGMIHVLINDKSELLLQDKSTLILHTSSSIYIGGVPHEIFPACQSMQGCIGDVKVSNDTWDKFHARSVPLVSSNWITKGCHDPCSKENHCNNGWCISDLLVNQSTCLCPSFVIGENCHKNISHETPINLNGKTYHCNVIEDTIIPFNFAVSIQPPYHSNGVIASFHGPPFVSVLYLSNYKPKYLLYDMKSFVINTISLDIMVLPNKEYTLSLIQSGRLMNLSIQANGIIEQTGVVILNEVVTLESKNKMVCIGGGFLDIEPYKGQMSILTYQGFTLDQPLCVTGSNITYEPSDGTTFISLWNRTLSSVSTISFDAWIEFPGSLFDVQNDEKHLNLVVFKKHLMLYYCTNHMDCYEHTCHDTGNEKNLDKMWLHISIKVIENNKLHISVGEFSCFLNESAFISAISKVPINIGRPNAKTQLNFTGYFKNLMINGKLINLEAINIYSPAFDKENLTSKYNVL
jgi:hypothetical protein